jgi:hypothetical protein
MQVTGLPTYDRVHRLCRLAWADDPSLMHSYWNTMPDSDIVWAKANARDLLGGIARWRSDSANLKAMSFFSEVTNKSPMSLLPKCVVCESALFFPTFVGKFGKRTFVSTLDYEVFKYAKAYNKSFTKAVPFCYFKSLLVSQTAVVSYLRQKWGFTMIVSELGPNGVFERMTPELAFAKLLANTA